MWICQILLRLFFAQLDMFLILFHIDGNGGIDSNQMHIILQSFCSGYRIAQVFGKSEHITGCLTDKGARCIGCAYIIEGRRIKDV